MAYRKFFAAGGAASPTSITPRLWSLFAQQLADNDGGRLTPSGRYGFDPIV